MTEHHYSLKELNLPASMLTIGTFDGVHLGHQEIVRTLVARAHREGIPAVVVTFHPHPSLVLSGEKKPYYLSLPEKRAQLLGELGVDQVITYPFTLKTSRLSADEFIRILHRSLRFEHLAIGHDFALGRNREGNAARLTELGKKYGFRLEQIPPFSLDGVVVSSSVIRGHLRAGEVDQAAHYLGRPFSLSGEVISGDSRGKSLGFPTANLAIPDQLVELSSGVYACYAVLGKETHPAVTNIGYRPTFDQPGGAPRVEAHLLDFERDIYGQTLELQFLSRLRSEKKFSGVEQLQEQVQADIRTARALFRSR